jgi:hypothetical protein
MKRLAVLSAAALVLAGCGEQCRVSSSEAYNRALVKRLALEGISSEVRPDKGGVCFGKRHSEKAQAAAQDLTKHLFDARMYLVDECREKVLLAWVAGTGIEYSVQEPAKHGGALKGKYLYLHSLTALQVEENKKRIMQAPPAPSCKQGGTK